MQQVLMYSLALFKHQMQTLTKLISTTYGWAIAAFCSVLTFFASEKYAFGVVLAAIFIDAVFGVIVSVQNGRFVLSKLGRVTLFKIASYMAALAMVFFIEKLAHDTGFFGVKVVAGWAVACEFWSMSASILIIWPEAAFFRIMRRYLHGEIAAKLGTDISDILPDIKK